MSAHLAASPLAGGHRYCVRVYYEDTDAGGVVYYANYLRFAERARTEALREAGAAHAEMTSQHGLMFLVRRIKLDYLAPARLDDSLVVLTRLLTLRPASVLLRQTFFREGEGQALADAEVLLVSVRADGGRPRPVPVPEKWRTALRKLA